MKRYTVRKTGEPTEFADFYGYYFGATRVHVIDERDGPHGLEYGVLVANGSDGEEDQELIWTPKDRIWEERRPL